MTSNTSRSTLSPDTVTAWSSVAPPSSTLRFGATCSPVPGRSIATPLMTSSPATIDEKADDATHGTGRPITSSPSTDTPERPRARN